MELAQLLSVARRWWWLLLIAMALSRVEEFTELELPPSEVQRYATLFGVRRRSLLALLGWLPAARFDGRRVHPSPPHCVGEEPGTWVRCWSRESAGRAAALNINDARTVEAWETASALHETPPFCTVHRWA